MKHKTLLKVFIVFVLSFMMNHAQAQDQIPGAEPDLGTLSAPFQPPAPLVDYAEEMRSFIQNIARFARRYDRDFIVIVKDAPKLLQEIIDIDLVVPTPSSVYIKSIDGIIQPGLSFGKTEFGVETRENERQEMMEDLNVAKEFGLKILTIDYVSKPEDVNKAFKTALENDFIPYAAPGKGFQVNRIASWPRRPINENSHTIQRLNQVKNFTIIRDSSRFGSRDEYALQMQATNFDMLITNPIHHRFQALSKNNLLTLQRKKLGSRRLVLGLMNIGFADRGAYYWQDNWRESNPSWILEPARQFPDKHMVQYWNPAWQQIMFGSSQSYVYGLIDQGYDGVVIDGAFAHEFFDEPDF